MYKTMVRISSSAARQKLPEAVTRAAYTGERTIIERHGKAIAAVVSVADLELLEAIEDRADIDAARRSLRSKGKSIPWAKAKKALGL
ncbi:MAG: type II toxin-antitoxin system Phd/YefM family antitoxin [Polyangiaceae bacterium]